MKTAFLLLLTLATLLSLSAAQTTLTPSWLENNLRHASYGPLTWWIPGISKFWALAGLAWAYLTMMAGFGRQDIVQKWFNELTMLYMPMTGYQYV